MKDEIARVAARLEVAGSGPDVFIEEAKKIACIALDHFNEELLDRALDIAKAVAKFAHEMERPDGG